MNKTRQSIILTLGVLLVVAIGLSVRTTAAFGNRTGADGLLTEGRELFYKQLKMALLLHPRAFSLEAEDINRILEAASHFSDLAAPINIGSTTIPETAAGLCGAAAAMISSQMPPTEKDLPGQYFQRIREILVRAASKYILNRRHFDPKMGYGLLDTANAVGKELEDYQARRKQIEDDFKRRLEARTEAQEEADKAGKEAEAKK